MSTENQDVVIMTADGPRAALPPGVISSDQMSRWYKLRHEEIVIEARDTLGDRATNLTNDDALRLFYHEIDAKG